MIKNVRRNENGINYTNESYGMKILSPKCATFLITIWFIT